MSDRRTKGTVLRAFGVDVDPLMVAGCIRELVDAGLIDHELLAHAEVFSNRVFELAWMVEDGRHVGGSSCSARTVAHTAIDRFRLYSFDVFFAAARNAGFSPPPCTQTLVPLT